jgi:YD repeat-containing protein
MGTPDVTTIARVLPDGESQFATYEYDANGNRATLTYNTNGDSTSYTYNLANKLSTLTNKKGTTSLSSYSYAYYLDGNQATKTDHLAGKVTSYVYDGVNRLASESPQGETVVNYTYDDSNNRKTMTIGSATTSYAYDRNNRLITETKVSGVISYAYDNNGNTITAGSTSSEYNGFNQLKKVSTGNTIAEYTYNADGLRISKTVNAAVTKYVWDGDQMAIELDGTGALTGKYVRGINLIAAENSTGTRKYYLFNGHGDVSQLTDAAGNVVKSYEYDAFGNEKNLNANDTNVFRYCGE